MGQWKAANMKMFATAMLLVFALGCSSTRGGVGIEWGSKEPVPPSEVKVVHRHGPPPHAPAHGYRAKHCYRYYPAREVYFDTERRIYFYIEGEVWKSGVSLPYHLRVSLGDYRTVEIYSDTPYEYHKKHKKKHKVPPGHAKKHKH